MIHRIHILNVPKKKQNEKQYNYDDQVVIQSLIQNQSEFGHAAQELCDNSLAEAKKHMHPLLQQASLERLGQRSEFMQAFMNALERESAKRISQWLPGVKAIYRFDSSCAGKRDEMLHLLVLVPRLSPFLKEFAAKLNSEILRWIKTFDWPRFQNSKSIIEIQQVTLEEIHHGVCYGAMFFSAYAVPTQVWPLR